MQEDRSPETKTISIAFAKEIRWIPCLGAVRAGFPSPEEESLCDVLSLEESLLTRPAASFLLKVSGDSMTGAGILPGDLVVVEKGLQPRNGDIVVAAADGEWTMKYFRRQDGQVVLEAANPRYPPIRPRTELTLGGIVTAVVRKYQR